MKPLWNAERFARQLRVRIAEKGITRKTAASQIGVSASTVTRVCNGKAPDMESYLRIKQWLAQSQTRGGSE